MARPSDWSALKLSGDPTPGDPDVLASVADYMDAMATNADTANTGLGQVVAKSGDGAFVGNTADWLRKQVTTEMQGFVAGVKQAFSASGPAIRAYVSSMRDAQSRADQALSSAAGAAGDTARLATLTSDAQTAGSDLKRAGSTAQSAIHDATAYIKSPTTPKSACDIFWEIFGWITLIISIVAIFIGGPLGLIAFGLNAVMAIKTIVDFAEGKTNVLGLVLGLLAVLGPSTRPLIALGDLTKLADAAWKNITKFVNSGAETIAKGIGDFWHTVSTISISTVVHGVGDLAVTLANTVKIGLLSIPKAVTALDGLAAHGFVALNKFFVTDIPKTLTGLPGVLKGGLTAIPGLAADLGQFIKIGAGKVGDLAVEELGGWKWLKIFVPLAGHEIGTLGLSDAFKLAILGRGLGIGSYKGLAALSGGVRLTEGLTTVNIIKPGDAPHFGGGDLNFTTSGLHLPDLTERSLVGIQAPSINGLSARGIDLSGTLSHIGGLDTAGLNGLSGLRGLNLDVHGVPIADIHDLGTINMPGAHAVNGGIDLTMLNKIDVSGLTALGNSVQHIKAPVLNGLGSIPLPTIHVGDLTAGLNKITNGVDGLSGFGGAELHALNTGDVNAIRISDTKISFNLGAPETTLGTHTGIDLSGTMHAATPPAVAHVTDIPHLDTTAMPHIETTAMPNIMAAAIPHLETGAIANIQVGSIGRIETTAMPNIQPGAIGHLENAAMPNIQAGAIPRLADGSIPNIQAGTVPHLADGTVTHFKAGNLPHLQTGDFHIGQLDDGTHSLSVDGAMNLLADPHTTVLHTPTNVPTHLNLTGLARDTSLTMPHLDHTNLGTPLQATHLQALEQLKRAQGALGDASGDALAIARAQKDIKVAESLVRRTADGIKIEPLDLHLSTDVPHTAPDIHPITANTPTSVHLDLTPPKPSGPVDEAFHSLQARLNNLHGADHQSPDLAGMELQHRFEQLRPVATPNPVHDLANLPAVPTHVPGESLADLQGRVDALRGGEHPSPDLADMELQYRFDQLRSATAHGATPIAFDPSRLPDVPTISPADAVARSTAAQRLSHLEHQLTVAKTEEIPVVPAPLLPHLDEAGLQARLDALHGSGADGLPDLPSVPKADPIAVPGGPELSVRLDHLTRDARAANLPGADLTTFTIDARTAIDDGRYGDAAAHLTDLHEHIDLHIIDQRLDAFRDHVDAGHQSVAQLGMDKVSWLGQAVDIERAAAAGHTADLHELLNAYEGTLASHLSVQKLHDLPSVPETTPMHGTDGAGVDATDALQTRLNALRDGAPPPDLGELGHIDQVHGDLGHGDPGHGDPGHDAGLSEHGELVLPDVPSHDLDAATVDADLAARLTALRGAHDHALNMSAAERSEWSAELGWSGDEASDLNVLNRYQERVASLDRDARIAALRDGPSTLPAAEHQSFQDALAHAGEHPASINTVLADYGARVAEHRIDTADAVHTALTAPDHLRPLGVRLEESLSGLSKDLREGNSAQFTTFSDRLDALRGSEPPVFDHGPDDHLDGTGSSSADALNALPDVPKDLPGQSIESPKGIEPPKVEPPKVDAPSTGLPKTTDLPKTEPATPGDGLMQLDPHLATHTVDDVVLPPRDLLGGGKPPTGSRAIEVDAERWTPLQDAFHFDHAGHDQPPTITRPAAGGERVGVRYQLSAGDHEWLFTVKVHLTADPAVTSVDLADLRARTTAGVDAYLNDPAYRLPGAQVPMRVAVEFVDDPAAAHAHITVATGVPVMNQAMWMVGAPPAAYAHEIVHYLGVTDGQPPPGALLHGPETTEHIHGDLMGSHGESGPYVLVPGSLAQIADVLAPHFSGSTALRPAVITDPGHLAEPFWASGADTPPQVTGATATQTIPMVPVSSTVPPVNSLPGLYGQRPELLYEVDSISDIDTLVQDVDTSVNDVVHARLAATWKGNVPFLPGRTVSAPEIGEALRNDPQSFFVTGGRSFEVRDGLYNWHRVTIKPVWQPQNAKVLDQSVDKAKFDTRTDHAVGSSQSATSGGTGSLGVSVTIPQRIGAGGGFGGEMALSRPLEFNETSARLTDSHNVRSGSGSHLVTTPARFSVTASEVRGPLDGTTSIPPTVGTSVDATVTFRQLDDIAKAKVASGGQIVVDLDKSRSLIVENLTPVRILQAGINLPPGTAPSDTWHDVTEQVLVKLAPTKAVDPGTIGAGEARDLFAESSILAQLMPALDGAVHPPTISSSHGSHALSVQMDATLPEMTVAADITKSSFRWQPGVTTGAKQSQTSRVGGALSVVPIRYAFGPAYVQFRLFGGFFRSLSATTAHSSTSRIGTEFKDIENVAVEAHIQLIVTPVLRELPGTRLPFTSGAVAPMTIDLVVLGRMPKNKAVELATGLSTIIPSPTKWYVPPYALTGGRSVTTGLSQFIQLQKDVTALIRRYEGGFLPKFADPGTVTKMGSSRAAIERQHNQAELDRVISPAGLRQGNPSLLKYGLIGELSRTKKIGTRHVIVHVIGRYTDTFTHTGTEKNVAVRNARADGLQQRIVAGGQWRGGATLEGGGVFRLTDHASIALVPSGAIEFRGRFGQQGGAQLSGQEGRLNGGTPDSQAFGNQLEITVHIYSYTKRTGIDPKSRVGVGRVVRQRLPRPAQGLTGLAQATRTHSQQVTGIRGKDFTRYRLVQQRPVTVLFDNASVTKTPITKTPTFTPRPDPMGVHRTTQLKLSTLRDWVDTLAPADTLKAPVHDWLSVEAMPGSTFILDMAKDALHGAQQYIDLASRTKIEGLRGTDALLEGMPLWARLITRLTESEQVGGLRPMLNDQWHLENITSDEDGAVVDLSVSASLTRPEIMPAHGTITTESASIGAVEVDGAKTTEKQLAARVNFSANIRKSGNTDTKSGGGGLINGGYERLLHARSERQSQSLSGAIERNVNNRKGKTRSYLVKFDLKVSVAAEVTTDPSRYAIIPQALRTGDWLHHVKSIQRDGTITNAVYLRLSAAVVERLGLLSKLKGDTGSFGRPWVPDPMTDLRLLPGHGSGLGLYTFHETPTLTAPMTAALRAATDSLDPQKGWIGSLLDAIGGKLQNRSIEKISNSLSGDGLSDPMLNRRRLLYLFTPDGVAQHWPSMADGGVSVLHMKPGKVTQHSRDIRLIAEPTGTPEFAGFVASHDDLDIKTTHISDKGTTVQKTHGHTIVGGAAGTAVSNHHGENLAVGLGDTVGHSSLVTNSQGIGQTSVNTELSSGRGVKARMKFPAKFSLVVFDKGKQVGSPLLIVHDVVEQDRWADDLRLPRPRTDTGAIPPIAAPLAYRIDAPATLPIGWRTLGGMPLPPRFTAEDLSQLAHLQGTVEGLLSNAAKRLSTPGYAGAHQIHQSLTPEIMLPGIPIMMSPDGLDLPAVTSAQIFGQKAKINIKLVPEAASLSGISSGVFREHAPQLNTRYNAGTNATTQALHAPRIPLLGRGFTDDAYQALESGGPGISAGDSQAATESGATSSGALGNTKPESRSAAIDYLNRIEVTITLPRTLTPTKIVESTGRTGDMAIVTLRMGLHDAKISLHIPADTSTILHDVPGRVADFDQIVTHEAKLAKAANDFVTAADNLDGTRFEGHAAAEGSAARAAAEAKLPALIDTFEQTGRTWWELEQRYYQLRDDFRNTYLGVAPTSASAVNRVALARRIQQQTIDSVEPAPATVPPNPADTTITPADTSNTTVKPIDTTVKPADTLDMTVKLPDTTVKTPDTVDTTIKPADLTIKPAEPTVKDADTTVKTPDLTIKNAGTGVKSLATTVKAESTVDNDALGPKATDLTPTSPVIESTPLLTDTSQKVPSVGANSVKIDVPPPTTGLGTDGTVVASKIDASAAKTEPATSNTDLTTGTPAPTTETALTTDVTIPKIESSQPDTTHLDVPGDGRCQLYSVIGSDPVRVSQGLAAAGFGTPEIHAWLNDPTAVRAEITRWTNLSVRDANGLVPGQTRLAQAAVQLRQLAVQHLQDLGPTGIPAQILEQYRNNTVAAVRTAAKSMDRATLTAALNAWGVTTVGNGQLLAVPVLRGAYIAARTAELVANGATEAAARALAEQDVPLQAAVAGSNATNLADASLSMQTMLNYLTSRGTTFGFSNLGDVLLRDLYVEHYRDPQRPPDATEFSTLTDAVLNWERHWHDSTGEVFLPLLAYALDSRMQINQPNLPPVTIGRSDAPLIEVYRNGNHYGAGVPATPTHAATSSSQIAQFTLLPIEELRDRYVAMRASKFVASGMDPAVSQVLADGIAPWQFAAHMTTYLQKRGVVTAGLSLADQRAVYIEMRVDEAGGDGAAVRAAAVQEVAWVLAAKAPGRQTMAQELAAALQFSSVAP